MIMDKTIYVIDTSYLLELFKVDHCYSEQASREITNRFRQAGKAGSLFFVPLPCIYELGNHIADVKGGTHRRQLANTLLGTIESCMKFNSPWTITPATCIKGLYTLWHDFAHEYVQYTKSKSSGKGGSIGLVDSSTIHEARRLKKEHKKSIYKVHIWTKDGTLKALEPDKESHPFIN